mgnify:CR=1 FL=1
MLSPLTSLPDSARNALAELIRLVEARFSGRVVLELSQGGVRTLEVTERLDAKALEQRQRSAAGLARDPGQA